MLRGGALSGPYHMHQMGSLSEPALSATASSSQPRAMPFLMPTRCAQESSGQQISSGMSGPPFTFIPGDGFLSPALDSKSDSTRQQASAAITTVNTLFPSSVRPDILILNPSSSSATHARADSHQMRRQPPFLSGDPTSTNISQSPGTSAESSQLSNGGRDGPGDPDKNEFSYNPLNAATASAEEASNSAAEEPWGGNQQDEAAIIAEHPLIHQQQDESRNDQKVRLGEASTMPQETDSTHEHHLRSAPSVFLSEDLKTVTKAQQQQPSEHDGNIVSDSTAAECVRAYPGETVAQSNVSEIFPSYNTNLMSSDSYNFPTGAELLGVPTQLQHSSNHPSRAVSVSDSLPAHSSGPFGDVNAPYTNQNLGRLGYNTAPALKGSWTNMNSHQYVSSSLLEPGNHSHSSLQAMSSIVGAPVSSLLSENLQDNPYGQGEPPSNRDGASFFSPLHTQAEAMQLCLNPTFGGSNSDSEPSITPPGNLVLMPHTGIDQHTQEHFLSLPVSPASLTQSALQAQRSQMLKHQGIPSAVQGYNNWRNGGNELLFLPGSDSSVHTQAFTGQMSTEQLHQQQQAELGISPHGSSRPPTLSSVNPLHQQHQQPIFQNGDGHSSPPGRLQGLSLSLSSQQPSALQLQLPNHHGRTHEADVDVFAVMSQSSVEAKGKRVQECTEGRYNGILSRFRPARDDNELAMSAVAQRLNAYGHTVEGRHSLLFNPGTEAYLTSGSNASYGPGPGNSGRFLKFSQFLLGEVCVVRKCERRTFLNTDHLRTPQRASWTAEQPSGASASNTFGSYHGASNRDVMAADSNLRRDYMMNMAALPGSSSSLPGRESLFPTHGQSESREDLDKKKMRLGAYLEEVDRRYRAYGEHMMDIMSQFNSTAGSEAATPYTALALQAMSRHFRCLREAVSAQLRAIKRALGEQDTSPGYAGRDISSLRFVDQQLRQQRTMQQLGMLQQHAWRPQRGLPERAVSVLRSWLFEHFLHPYPKDSDKLFLAKQTGLTRSQVSNWFINARVRLWKPMVEEMYLEEFNNSDEGGSAERKTSRERRRENEAMEYSDANIAASSFSNGHNEIGTADKQRIAIACGGDGMYNNPQSSMRSTAHNSNQNGSTSNSLDFDADQRDGALKKARNGMHNPPDIMGSPIVGMDIGSVSPGFHDPSRLDGNYGSSEHEYSQHQEILAAANGGRFAAYLGSNLSGYAGAQSFVPGTATTNGGVSLTLGLRHSDGLALPGAAAASHHSKYSNPGHPNSQGHKDHFDTGAIQDVALRAIDNVHSELSITHNMNLGQEDQKQRNRLSTHLLHEFDAQEPSRDTIDIFRS